MPSSSCPRMEMPPSSRTRPSLASTRFVRTSSPFFQLPFGVRLAQRKHPEPPRVGISGERVEHRQGGEHAVVDGELAGRLRKSGVVVAA